MMKRNLKQVWDQLRGQQPTRTERLRHVTVRGLRGIRDVRVALGYPVVVLAGPNGCGKSTVLFSLACAYRPPGAGPRDFVPSTLFPNFHATQPGLPSDRGPDVELEFDYLVEGRPAQLRWRRKKNWNRSGFAGGGAPERALYLRTLANLSSPSEVRSLLTLGRRPLLTQPIDAADVTLAHRILPWHYTDVTRLHSRSKELLFASRPDEVSYSEFHMSSGERSILRLSLDLSRLQNALVLIDEVETGLHPFTQQALMLELQRLALRNRLQIVVATHSPVVLDSVPPEGRVFLERVGDNVVVTPSHHDLIQRALYGQVLDRLAIVCEDESAEAVIRGIFDDLGPRLDLLQGEVEIGRDTGKDEFKHHVAAFARFRRLWSTLFVLDGAGRDLIPVLEAAAERQGQAARVVSLPGGGAPELWAWSMIEGHADEYARLLGREPEPFREQCARVTRMYAGAADRESNKAKGRIWALAEVLGREATSLLRLVGRHEAERGTGDLQAVIAFLQDSVAVWRTMRGDQ